MFFRVFSCQTGRRCTSNSVLACIFATKPLLEVAGFEQAQPRMQKSTSALCTCSEQAKHSIRGML